MSLLVLNSITAAVLNTITAAYISITYQSAATTTTCTFQNGVIEVIKT